MNPRTFTQLLLQHSLADPTMSETVRQWHQTEPDPERRAMLFACAMAEDCIAAFRLGGDAPETVLRNALMRLALDRVNWRLVVDQLLRRFSLPIYATSSPRCRPRWSPAIAAGSMN